MQSSYASFNINPSDIYLDTPNGAVNISKKIREFFLNDIFEKSYCIFCDHHRLLHNVQTPMAVVTCMRCAQAIRTKEVVCCDFLNYCDKFETEILLRTLEKILDDMQ